MYVGFIGIAANLLGIGELLKEPRFGGGTACQTPADDAELRATLTRILQTQPYAHWAAAFEQADVPFAPARLTEDGLDDRQVLHNAMVTTLEDPAVGAVAQMGVPVHLTATPGRVSGPRAAHVVPVQDWMGSSPPRATVDAAAEAPTSPSPAPPPLAGVRILEITNLIAGPTTGRILADLGADVIKLEPPAGDMSRPIGRSYFYAVNFNKRSICVDTGTPAGKAIVQKIAASADALVANLRPQATARMGIGPQSHPRLIETHLTGYGWTGPYSKRPGIDPLAQALMGLQRAQGGPDNPPVFPAQLAPTDYTTGAMGALGTILALLARQKTGVVQRVESNLLSGGIVLSSAWFTRHAGKPVRPLADKDQYGLTPFHRLYALRDGWIYVVAESAAQRQAMCKLLGVDAAVHGETTNPGKAGGVHPNETPFAATLAAAMARRTASETLAALAAAGVPCAPAPAPGSAIFLDDPHPQANDMVAIRHHPRAGAMRVAWHTIQFRDTEPTLGRHTPLLGEHSAEVLREIGLSADEIEALHANGVVRTETA